MTSPVTTFLLGCLQGATEFLPISSSGHLVLAQYILRVKEQSLLLDVWLHFGTLLAILVVLHKPVSELLKGAWEGVLQGKRVLHFMRQPEGKGAYRLWLVMAASVPTACIGFAFKDTFERLFEGNVLLVGVAFLFTALLLFLTKFQEVEEERKGARLNLWRALAIGVIQGIAIIPGISRSGSTIALALLLGVSRKEAGEFSFLIVIPAIFGAMILESLHGRAALINSQFLFPALIGLGAAFGVGIVALKILLRLVNHGKLYKFSYYCMVIGGISLWIGWSNI